LVKACRLRLDGNSIHMEYTVDTVLCNLMVSINMALIFQAETPWVFHAEQSICRPITEFNHSINQAKPLQIGITKLTGCSVNRLSCHNNSQPIKKEQKRGTRSRLGKFPGDKKHRPIPHGQGHIILPFLKGCCSKKF
jgi:hypothetical protein